MAIDIGKKASAETQKTLAVSGTQETLAALLSQLAGTEKYTLAQAIDETLALLGGEAAVATYLGYPLERGPTLLQQLADLEGRVKALETQL